MTTPAQDAAYVRGMRDGHGLGRSETLWLVAIGACWQCWFTVWGWHPDAMMAAHDTSMAALRALSAMGDERAAVLLRGGGEP